MSTLQIECTCNSCNAKWFYLPFEEARMVMAEMLRIRTRELGWRERQRYFGRSGFQSCGCGRGCGCGNPGCPCLEVFACTEIFGSCGRGSCCIPGCGVAGFSLLLPFSNWFYPFIHMAQIKKIPNVHRKCPACGSGWFERVVAKYEDQGNKRTVESITWQLPVINPIQVFPVV